MITHKNKVGEKFILDNSINVGTVNQREYNIMFDNEKERLFLKHESGEIVWLYSEYEMKHKKEIK